MKYLGRSDGVEYLVGVIIGDRHLGRRDQGKLPVVLDVKQVVFEFRQLVGAEKSRAVYEKRRQRFGVSVLDRVDVEHKIDQRPLEPCTCTV